ncbi:MAG: exodeoxyribonuclease V subunit beta [Burkholderiaceae bacterium]|nr:exodeoxyribonuclease V subunit beta [Burkholderiaceae bacterium]
MNGHPVFEAGILDGVQLLEADAGTGKTWTIAGLAVRAIVERGLDLGRVLVVTFTNAAAAELAERIRLRVAQLERLLDDRLAGRSYDGVDEPFCTAYAATLDDAGARRARDLLRVALARVDEMSVHTIHAWCQRVIDEHALSIGVARGLPIGAGDGERIARRVRDWWRSEVLEAPGERIALFALAGLDPQAIEDDVEAIVSLPLARVASPACDWRTLAARALAARASLVDAMRTDAVDLLAWMRVPANVSGSIKQYGPKWLAALKAFCEAPLAPMSRDTIERLGTHRFPKAMPDSAIPGCCDALLAIDGELAGLRASVAQEIVASLRRTRDADLAQAGSLAFDDLLRLVFEALDDPASGAALARTLREGHPIALVDECQDTDPLQWEILRRVYPAAGEAETDFALVLVGDPKQAIYSFRGADVHSYLSARAGASRTHRLAENQRSQPALIEAVNALFRVDDPFRVAGIAFEPALIGARTRRAFDAADPPGAGARAPMTVVMLEPGAGGRPLSAPQARRQAVDATVAEIARLLASPVRYDDRVLQPRDIAVLVHARAQGGVVKRALARAGIGAAEISRDSVLDTLESAELLRVVAAVDDCADPGRLRSALATTLLGFDAAAIGALEDDSARLLAVVARFADARARWQRHGPIASLRPLLHDFGAGARLAGLVDGERRLTDLGHLVTLLAEDDALRESPRDATRAWARLRGRETGDDDTRELRLESDENLVRILTVHKSKGLEFPIVFVPFAWSGRKAQAPDPCVRHERDAGGAWRTVLDLAPDQAARDEAAAERQAENLRTLYVALTRAEQRCYLFWGTTSTSAHAPLAWLLHEASAQGGASFALDAPGVRGALAQWQTRAGLRHPGALAVVPGALAVVPGALAVVDTPTLFAGARESGCFGAQATDAEGTATARPGGEAPVLHARSSDIAIPPAAVTTSFSAIASVLAGSGERSSQSWPNVDVVDPGRDESAEDAGEAPPPRVLPAAGGESIRFRFPAGAQAGVCLHGILEQAAFDAPIDAALVAHWLGRCGYRRSEAAQVGAWLDETLRVVLRAPDGTRLALPQVPRARQLREMEFQLSGRSVSERALVGALDDAIAVDAQAALSRWSGFLRGFVDLVFEHDGRWYLVDWKSNHLGDDAGRYRHAALAEAMRARAYPLQANLYTLAVHRWLRRTLPGYGYERSFGGVFYVFLRGAGLPASEDPAAGVCGVHASRPSARAIERLDRLFDGQPVGLSR